MIGNPIFTYGDIVKFRIEEEIRTGEIIVVDSYGTMEQSEEVSYDIRNGEERMLYKHIRESYIIEKC